nr:hypothetical protein BaRGS_006242 [Batillaria attramentaria]
MTDMDTGILQDISPSRVYRVYRDSAMTELGQFAGVSANSKEDKISDNGTQIINTTTVRPPTEAELRTFRRRVNDSELQIFGKLIDAFSATLTQAHIPFFLYGGRWLVRGVITGQSLGTTTWILLFLSPRNTKWYSY